jgi:hypothetical protein
VKLYIHIYTTTKKILTTDQPTHTHTHTKILIFTYLNWQKCQCGEIYRGGGEKKEKALTIKKIKSTRSQNVHHSSHTSASASVCSSLSPSISTISYDHPLYLHIFQLDTQKHIHTRDSPKRRRKPAINAKEKKTTTTLYIKNLVFSRHSN